MISGEVKVKIIGEWDVCCVNYFVFGIDDIDVFIGDKREGVIGVFCNKNVVFIRVVFKLNGIVCCCGF